MSEGYNGEDRRDYSRVLKKLDDIDAKLFSLQTEVAKYSAVLGERCPLHGRRIDRLENGVIAVVIGMLGLIGKTVVDLFTSK